jgi:DNA topoisomerase-6 subunit B
VGDALRSVTEGFNLTAITAEQLAKQHKEISIAEFFERNKHILGFDTPTRAMLSSVKEAVDNSLDVCEETKTLPDILVEIKKIEDRPDEFNIIVEDNGPGITKRQIPHVFGRLLYGSRFHAIRQFRGQQGIGISAVVMYGQLTTGRPARILSKTGKDEPAHQIALVINTKKNKPEVLKDEVVLWDKDHGTRLEIQIRGRYVRERRQSILAYIRSTAIVNPHAKITFIEPDDKNNLFERVTDKLPKMTKEIKPHPEGIELGTLLNMLKLTEHKRLTSFLVEEFSRVSYKTARQICEKAGLEGNIKPKKINLDSARSILTAFGKVKIMAPSTDCLSPIGDILIKKGLKNVLEGVRPEFYAPPVTRDAQVYSGNPFQVEVGLVYGGELKKDEPVDILRIANRVPLLYQQGDCVSTKAIESIDWRNYGLEQRGGRGMPSGPAIILDHVASTNVPFTSESKEAIADIPIIRKEIVNALKLCGRKLRTHVHKTARRNKIREKFEIVQKILPVLAEKAAKIAKKPVPKLDHVIAKIMNIVWIEDSVEYEKNRYIVKIQVRNLTQRKRKFKLIAEHPVAKVENVKPKASKTEEGTIFWNLTNITPTENRELSFELVGLEKGALDEAELFIEGIDPIHVVGAEPWNSV